MIYSSKALWLFLAILVLVAQSQLDQPPDGAAANERGLQLFQKGDYTAAAPHLWTAVLFHTQSPTYDVGQTFQLFLKCYMQQGKLGDGLAFVAKESFQRGQVDMGHNYLQQALEVQPDNAVALQLKAQHVDGGSSDSKTAGSAASSSSSASSTSAASEFAGKSPEDLYALASEAFSSKNYERCADIFEISCDLSQQTLGPSCANAVYCRHNIIDWGFNGSQFDADMERIERLVKQETQQLRSVDSKNTIHWRRTTSPHPHMMLAYPIDVMLKRYVAEATAYMDEPMARLSSAPAGTTSLPPLPSDLPFVHDPQQYQDNNNRLKIGFVGSGFNSKAVLYLSHDMFRFFSKDIEIHVFSFGPPDHPQFIQRGMAGADWRERVKSNVDYFHDCQTMTDHTEIARFIHSKNIQILLEWDGYARQGERAQGLFALRPAPIQILHQEYLGTSGAQFVDYLFTDMVASPVKLQGSYVEKLIYLPNHFFSKGHALQKEVKKPTYDYLPAERPHRLGTGSPQENRCLGNAENVSFVYCNFNKFLKNNPETVRSWIRILREVPDSILCLLENPADGVPYLKKFIHEAAGSGGEENFVAGDGDALIDRIFFLPWENSPFVHQTRNFDFCNAMLDSHPYNGHTVAQDALYAGVSIVTRSDGDDMGSRVSSSANIVLKVDEHLNGIGPTEYEDKAISLGRDPTLFRQIRTQLIDAALQRNPMHPYWDVGRYVLNFESALRTVWDRFRRGEAPDHIHVEESSEAQAGTSDDKLARHPVQGRKARLLK